MPKLSLPVGRRPTSLKRQFLLLLIAVYLLTGAVALGAFVWGSYGIIQQLTEDFAAQYVLRQKSRLLAPIQREIALSQQMVDSPLLQRWARNEDDPALKAAALAELDSYRRHFADRSYFFVVNASGHYYHNNAADEYRGHELRYTLDPAKPTDRWYFATLAKIANFDLNVDYDAPLDVTKVWINAVVKDGMDQLGLGGTGLELDSFIQAVLSEDRLGVNTLLLDRAGTIRAHHQRAYIDFNTVAKSEAERSTLYRLLTAPGDAARLQAQLERVAAGQIPVAVLPLTVENQSTLAAIAWLPEIQWFVVTLVDAADVYSVWRFAPFAGLLIVSLLSMTVAVTLLLNRLVIGPLARLHQSTHAIAAGDYGRLAAVEAHNEIGELTRDFNQMAQAVRDHAERLEQRVAERTQELDQAHRQLAAAHQQVLDSIQYAQLIQQAILPQPELLARALGEHFVIWRPRDLVGGDFYYCRADEQGCLLVVADCTGHGVPGALMTMAVHAVLNHITSTLGNDDPAGVLQALNQQLRATLRQDEMGEGFENGLDAAVCYWTWAGSALVFAGARLDLFYRDADGAVTVARGDGRSLGYRRADRVETFTPHPVARAPGRVFYLTTDGLLDQSGGPKGYGFGRRRWQDFLQQCREPALAAQQAALEQTLAAWQEGQPQRDDITVLGFRLDAGPQAAFRENAW